MLSAGVNFEMSKLCVAQKNMPHIKIVSADMSCVFLRDVVVTQ